MTEQDKSLIKSGDDEPSSSDEANPATEDGADNLSEEQFERIFSSPQAKNFLDKAKTAGASAGQSVADKKAFGINEQVKQIRETVKELEEGGLSRELAEKLAPQFTTTPETLDDPTGKVSADVETIQPDLNFKEVFVAAKIDPNSKTALELAKASGGDAVKLLSSIIRHQDEVKSKDGDVTLANLVPEDTSTPAKVNPIADINDPEELLKIAFSRKK